ncbi:hypothetical protein [Phocaeicola sartorii]|uniref:hypothetical protein n=1 Tax=Phocaeicola sartorii TaxID=671267 RepID=UPI0025582218|nr:hypothetical protein [Phocaeicola sartorii]
MLRLTALRGPTFSGKSSIYAFRLRLTTEGGENRLSTFSDKSLRINVNILKVATENRLNNAIVY